MNHNKTYIGKYIIFSCFAWLDCLVCRAGPGSSVQLRLPLLPRLLCPDQDCHLSSSPLINLHCRRNTPTHWTNKLSHFSHSATSLLGLGCCGRKSATLVYKSIKWLKHELISAWILQSDWLEISPAPTGAGRGSNAPIISSQTFRRKGNSPGQKCSCIIVS